MKKGVEILLRYDTPVPVWISNQDLNVSGSMKTFGEEQVYSLRIKNGEAGFIPGGRVEVKMPGSRRFYVAFKELQVFEIRDLEGKLLKRNYFLCEKCFTNTGKMSKESPSETYGRTDVVMQCTECGNTWEHKGI